MLSRLFSMVVWCSVCWYSVHFFATSLAGGAALGPYPGRSPVAFFKNDLHFLCGFGHADREAECLARIK